MSLNCTRRAVLACALTLAAIAAPDGQAPSTLEQRTTPATPAAAPPAPPPAGAPRLFDFGPGDVAPGAEQVLATTLYSRERGFGFVDTAGLECLDRGGTSAL